jgi:uncharacterized membrane protein YkoI
MYPVAEDKNGKLISGFYAAMSHRIKEHEDCLIGAEIFSKIKNSAVEVLENLEIPAYNEETKKGVIRCIYMRKNTKNEVLLTFIVNADTLGEAKEKALFHANLSAEDVTFRKCELDKDNIIYVYELEFIAREKTYEYEISAIDGAVIECSWEAFFKNEQKNDNIEKEISDTSDTKIPDVSDIETEKAKNIAFKDAGIEKPEMPHKIENKHGQKGHEIEIEFSTEGGHFKYEINAETDEITNKEFKPFKENEKTGKEIGLDEAKKKVLEHMSASEDEVIFTKAKLDKEDSESEYDIEFIHKGKKHEFSIHATTGEILEIDD